MATSTASTTDLKPNDIAFSLDIKLDMPPAPISEFCVNLQADKSAKLLDITASRIDRPDEILQIYIEYSEEQQNTLVIYDKDTIEFTARDNSKKTYNFPSNRVTIKQFVDAIIDFEKFDRPKYGWGLGGIDCHHIFYEGIHPTKDGAYSILWGS